MSKIIICAVTSAVRTPSMSPNLPITMDKISQKSMEAAAAGAATLHLHARDPSG
ncbi:3-keto-5-aminohexanoate cleavage protein, partial [Pseudorhodobacter sp.]|uniref:3-keto-5-aminohexanoate cleavage protein n=1 Tax=Pseudorhodobacter sp. TaxID=1934400 RepID=UPI0026498999